MNVDRTGEPGVAALVAVGDSFCHTDPAFAYGLSFALAHAQALGQAAAAAPDADAVAEAYRSAVRPEAQERYRLACDTDAARSGRWSRRATRPGLGGGLLPAVLVRHRAWPPHRTTTTSCGARSGASACWTARRCSTATAGLHRRIEAIFGELTAHHRHRPDRRGTSSRAV